MEMVWVRIGSSVGSSSMLMVSVVVSVISFRLFSSVVVQVLELCFLATFRRVSEVLRL